MSRSDNPGGNFDFIANRNEVPCGLSEKRHALGRVRSTQNRAPRGSRKSSFNNRKGYQRRVQSERLFSGQETCMNVAHQSRRDDNGNDLSPAPAPLDRKGGSSTNQGLTARRPRGEPLQSSRNLSTMLNKYEEFSSSTESQTLSAISGGGGGPEIQALKKSQPVPNDQRQEQQSGGMFLQPEIHPMTEEELKNEIRGIYGGLSMVEQKCIELVKYYNENLGKLDEVAWQTLLTLHRTLLHEHFDFFLATNHKVAESFVPETMPNETTQKSSSADSIQQSPNEELRGLAKKYSMPARMWRYGIHAFLELLRKKLPSSLEHMLSFIYMAYSMMSLLLESVPEFQETWIECLGDLARYRMAIEELDMRDREVYMGVARYWYIKAAELNPEVGRIQHHLAVLARPNLLQQLFYYTKALISVRAFSNARDSISLLFNPLLDPEKAATKYSRHYPRLLTVLVEAHGILFTRRDSATFLRLADEFLSDLAQHAGTVGPLFREQGIYITASNYAAIFDYGQDEAEIPPLFNRAELTHDKREEILDIAYKYWQESACIQKGIEARMSGLQTPQISGTAQVSSLASHLAFTTLDVILERLKDRNTLPSVHISLAFLWCLAMVPESMEHIQADVPWLGLAKYLNALIKPDTNLSEIEQGDFPAQESGPSQQLPEDFLILGFSWSRLYFPRGFFAVMAEEAERTIEFPTVTIPRTRRCLWLAFRIAKFRRWLVYDSESRQFQATQYAHQLAALSGQYQLLCQDRSSSSKADQDVEMAGS